MWRVNWDHHGVGGLVPIVHGRAPRATRRACERADAAARVGEGPVGPRGQAGARWLGQTTVVLTAAALVEPRALAVHLEHMDVVGETVEECPGEPL